MTRIELDELADKAACKVFAEHSDARKFFHMVSMLWRHTPENILAIYMQDSDATCVAGIKAFNALGYTLKAKEKPLYIYNTVVRRRDEGSSYISEYLPVQAYDIRQFEAQDKEAVENGQADSFDCGKLCGSEGVPILEVDRLPSEMSYYGAYYDTDEQKIVLRRDLQGDGRASAIIYGYVHADLHKYQDDDHVLGINLADKGVSLENVALLSVYCVESHYGIKPSVTNLGIILSNVEERLSDDRDKKMFLSYVCLMVQRIIRAIESNVLTVEEISIINSLMVTDEADVLKEMLERLKGQTGIDVGVRLSICHVFAKLFERISEDELSALYDARIHKSLYTYPEFRIRTGDFKDSGGECESKRYL